MLEEQDGIFEAGELGALGGVDAVGTQPSAKASRGLSMKVEYRSIRLKRW